MNIDIYKAKEFFEKNVGVTPVAAPTTKKKHIPHEIVWMGQVIKLRSGKSVWNSLGSAKIALRDKVTLDILINSCVSNIPESFYSEYDGIFKRKYLRHESKSSIYYQIIDELQKAGILEFRPVK